METNTLDITKLSAAELKAELKRREAAIQEDRKAYKELVNETVPGLIKRLKWISEILQTAKVDTFRGVTDLMELKEKAYGIKDEQRSHTFTTEEGDSITLGVRVNDGWDDTVGSGIAKVNKFLESKAKDEDSALLVKTINRLLKKDAKGNLKSSRVVELSNLAEEFDDPEFSDGVRIIRAAYKPVESVHFIEATTKSIEGKDESIPLAISSVKFPEGTELPFFETKL